MMDLFLLKEKHHRSLPVSETYVLNGLQPNTLYYIWLAAKSKRGEGATTPPIPVRTDQYGKSLSVNCVSLSNKCNIVIETRRDSSRINFHSTDSQVSSLFRTHLSNDKKKIKTNKTTNKRCGTRCQIFGCCCCRRPVLSRTLWFICWLFWLTSICIQWRLCMLSLWKPYARH